MKFLLDIGAPTVRDKIAAYPEVVCGQLLTPLTRYSNWGGQFAIDNGAFVRFDAAGFRSLLDREKERRQSCLFVCAPDVVGSARRTLEVFQRWYCTLQPWPVALVAQDGLEDLEIPWDILAAMFIGGSTEWKMSKYAADVVRAAVCLGVHVHIGRVNTPRRYRHFERLGANTCDGSGVSRFDHMLEQIANGTDDDNARLFPAEEVA